MVDIYGTDWKGRKKLSNIKRTGRLIRIEAGSRLISKDSAMSKDCLDELECKILKSENWSSLLQEICRMIADRGVHVPLFLGGNVTGFYNWRPCDHRYRLGVNGWYNQCTSPCHNWSNYINYTTPNRISDCKESLK